MSKHNVMVKAALPAPPIPLLSDWPMGTEVQIYIPAKGKICGYTYEDGRPLFVVNVDDGLWIVKPSDLEEAKP